MQPPNSHEAREDVARKQRRVGFVILSLILIALCLTSYLFTRAEADYKLRHTPSVEEPKNSPEAESEDSSLDELSNTIEASPGDIPGEPAASCHTRGLLPDPACTPGAIDPRVTQDNLRDTICKPGYSKSVRPPVNVTAPMKRASMAQYGFTDSPANYEYDHLISLQLGGAPADPKNLWPEPDASPNDKDAVENRLHDLVCEGRTSLSAAQQRIATDWTTALSGY